MQAAALPKMSKKNAETVHLSCTVFAQKPICNQHLDDLILVGIWMNALIGIHPVKKQLLRHVKYAVVVFKNLILRF